MTYTLYATKDDIIAFTGKTIDTLPNNIDMLISRASDLITNSIIAEIKSPDHDEALKLATCAQVEYMFTAGTQDVNGRQIKAYSAGSTSVTYADDGPKRPLCPLARSYLNKQALLYRGVRTTIRWGERSDEQL